MKKQLLIVISLILGFNFVSVANDHTFKKLSSEQVNLLLDKTKDVTFTNVLPQNILANSVYVELAKEGWTVGEIIRLTDEYLAANKAQLKQEGSNIDYAKYWRPYYVSSNILTSTIADYTNPEELQKAKKVVESTQDDPHAYYPRIFYTPADRLAGTRNPGYFRHNAIMPAGGRMHWMAVNPDDANKMMVIPDSEGIYRTDDMGKTWDCITHRIPNRYDRNGADNYSLPVDPDNWDHIYAFMANSTVYKTFDGGQSWSKVNGATHKGFKRGYAFRDASGNLRFIGAKPTQNNGIGAQLWLSRDTCKNWSNIKPNSAQVDITVNGTKTFWFQEISFHPTNRDVLYAAGSRAILKSTDAGESWNRMKFKVHGPTTATVRAASTELFPLATANAPMFLEINPSNGDEMWAALSTRENAGHSALYKTTDGGESWITLQEPSANIGSGGIFGNESAWNWLGGFTVNFADQRYVYGCSMSSGESTNSGKNFTEYPWHWRHQGFYPDGRILDVSCATHNADNHFLRGHKSGRVFRGSDAGLFMKDKDINGHKWTNITGNMGEMMFYTGTHNEFSDLAITGNTQDINIQFYRGGRWGQSQGYEGSTIWMNPFSSEEHFPYLTGGGTAIQNQDYGSWSRAWTAADVCTGNWFIRREGTNSDGSRFAVIKDFGKKSIGIDNSSAWVQDFALSRDVPGGKLFIVKNNRLFVSTDAGSTFTQVNTGSYSGQKVAVNPNNSDEIYFARTGIVYKTTNGGKNWSIISTAALSGVELTSFYYHEGSGDLYFVSKKHGIFLKESNSTEWKLWTKGYNTAKLADAQINYTTQEMIITDYGTGIWQADLQNPADRYLKNGFALKQTSNINNIRSFGIDVHFTIPMYYYYKWYVNGVHQTNETGQQFSSAALKANDKVKLVVTLRESPDVSSTSAEFVVQNEESTVIPNTRGNYLYSNQRGRLDLGYVDQFFGNFSIQMWVNPKSDGVILANRQAKTNSVKGFYLAINSGRLSFNYTPEHNIVQPFNETYQESNFSLTAGAIKMNEWSQITINHDRQGDITIFVNGEQKAKSARQKKDFTLNNAVYLSLFADGYEYNPIEASVDELKIWNDVLDQTDIRKSMFGSATPANAKLIYYNDFNATTLEDQKERFSQKGMMPRTEAQITINENAIGICADYQEYKQISTTGTTFMKDAVVAMEIKSNDAAFTPSVAGLIYNQSIIGNKTNLLPDYFNIYDLAYGIKMFDVANLNKPVNLKFYLSDEKANDFKTAILYSLDLTAEQEIWERQTALTYNEADKSLSLVNVLASAIDNKRFVLVKPSPAIELKTTSIGNDRQLNIYSPEKLKVSFEASLIGGLTAPGSYTIKSDNSIVKSLSPLVFTNNKGIGEIELEIGEESLFNSSTEVTISGEDKKMIPFSFSVTNKITPKNNDVGIHINKGGANIGSAATFSALSRKNTATYMGWFKLDDATMLTGYKMLMFFRDSGSPATGIALKDGKIGCHWNDENWSWDVNSGLILTSADLGKWVHIAMTASPRGLEFYLNGRKGTAISRTLNGATINAGLMLGKNHNGDADYIGSMDQIALWNRTLSDDEIVKYMHSRVLLNDQNLISYITFDNEESEGGFIDLKSNASIMFNGTMFKNKTAKFPFDFESQQARTRKDDNATVIDGVAFTLPTSYPATYKFYTSFFKGRPFNYIDTKYPTQKTLEDGYRTFSLGYNKVFSSSEEFVITVENPAIVAGGEIVFRARPMGSEANFNIRYTTIAETGKASFTIPATVFNEDLIYMIQYISTAPTAVENNTLYRYKLSVSNKICTIQNLRADATITIIDMHGRIINTQQTKSPRWSMELPQGTFIVKIEELAETVMTKIVL